MARSAEFQRQSPAHQRLDLRIKRGAEVRLLQPRNRQQQIGQTDRIGLRLLPDLFHGGVGCHRLTRPTDLAPEGDPPTRSANFPRRDALSGQSAPPRFSKQQRG